MKDLNQYLYKRGDRWHYVRRVPNEFRKIDKRNFIRKSLKTESLELARLRRDELVKADNAFWASLSVRTTREADANSTHAQKKYDNARNIAMANGFAYSGIEQIVHGDLEELISRVTLLENAPGNIAPKDLSDAILGTVSKPKLTITQALELYCNEIAASELLGMSAAQKRSWHRSKNRAIKNFVAVAGDLYMNEIERKHARQFYNWWAELFSHSLKKKGKIRIVCQG